MWKMGVETTQVLGRKHGRCASTRNHALHKLTTHAWVFTHLITQCSFHYFFTSRFEYD